MSELGEKVTIKLMVGKQFYPVTIKPEQEEIYRKAAKMVNERLNLYQTKYAGQAYEKYMSVVLVDFAIKVLQAEQIHSVAPFIDTIEKLDAELEEVLNQK